ncbi:MAG TPA: cytochrome C [Ignavibacteria bacterium]|nr:cytochrome C [Ignavibacteria bacterium]
MRKFLKISGIIFAVILFILLIGYGYIMTQYPKSLPAPDMKITATPQMYERGKYLANTFASCTDCHSDRNPDKFGNPLIESTIGKGGQDYGEGAGYVPASNITSDKETGIGNWTDGEIFRAITMGIDKKGEALGPMMPYLYFRNMDEEDVKSIIVYIRSLPPIRNEVKEHKFNFPVNLIFRTLPTAPDFKKKPDENNTIALGEYYSGGCLSCHSPMEKGEFINDKLYSGGVEYPAPKGGIVRSGNITPDKETGIGNWSKEQFIQKFRAFKNPEVTNVTVNENEFNTVMPWTFYADATDADLGAVYDFLMTQKPVNHKVEKFSPKDKYNPNN